MSQSADRQIDPSRSKALAPEAIAEMIRMCLVLFGHEQ
jgi:hypothetical protein